MNPLLSVSLGLALIMLVCCENSEEEDWDHYDYTEFNWTDPDDFNLTDFDFSWPDYANFSTTDFVYNSFDEDESNFRNKASGIGQLKPVFLLGLAILQIWN